jgi:hypothetical protein
MLAKLNIWPVIQRELREGARRPVNHRIRLGTAFVGTVLLWLIVANSDVATVELGGWLLAALHSLLLGLIFLIVPALPADCIARENREGTLGLLAAAVFLESAVEPMVPLPGLFAARLGDSASS